MHIPITSPELTSSGAFRTRVVAPSAALASLILFTAIFFGFITAPGQTPDFTCTPNGAIKFPWSNPNSPWVASRPYSSIWDSSQFLSITLGFGDFTFPQAKAIDFLWDLVVGRGAQLTLMWRCYPVFRRALSTKLETGSISLPVFAALAFDKVGWTSIGALLSPDNYHWVPLAERSADNCATENGARRTRVGRLALFAVTFAYLLIFPTWLSIMTGYQAISKPYVQTLNENLVPTTALAQPDAIVLDGPRIGLSVNRTVFRSNEPGLYHVLSAYMNELWALPSLVDVNTDDTLSDQSSSPPLWTFSVTSQEPQNKNLRPLACTAICYSVTDCPKYCSRLTSSTILVGNTTYTLSPQPLNVAVSLGGTNYALEFRSYGDQALPTTYLEEHTTCEPTARYHWGFSSELLFTFCIVSMLFAMIMLLLDAQAYWHGRADRQDVSANVYRDALDLSMELRAQHGEAIEQMPAKEVIELVEKERGRIFLDVENLPQSRKRVHQEERARAIPTVDRQAMVQFLDQARAKRNVAPETVRLHSTKDNPVIADEIELETVDRGGSRV